jgi:hypothetical protein
VVGVPIVDSVVVTAVLVAVGLGLGALALAAKRVRDRGPSAPRGQRIDPFTVGEPWRRHVAAAMSAQRRFRSIVTDLAPGPLQTRLAEIGRDIDRGVESCWEVARRGDALDDTIRRLDAPALRASLTAAGDDTTLTTSIGNQLGAVDRVRATRDDTEAKLRLAQTRLGEIVGQAAELSAQAGADAGGAEELGSAVDLVVTQLEALRLASNELGPGGVTPAPG